MWAPTTASPGRAARGGIQENHGDGAAQHRPEHGVVVEDAEVNDGGLLAANRVEVLQVFGDIAGGGEGLFGALSS